MLLIKYFEFQKRTKLIEASTHGLRSISDKIGNVLKLTEHFTYRLQYLFSRIVTLEANGTRMKIDERSMKARNWMQSGIVRSLFILWFGPYYTPFYSAIVKD